MGVLWAGGEDTSVTGTGIAFSAVGTRYRTAWARGTLGVTFNSGTTDPPTNRIVLPTFTAGSTVWFHGQFWDTGATPVNNQIALVMRSPDGVARILLRQTSTYGQLKISTRNAAGTIADLVTSSSPAWTTVSVHQIDLQIVYGVSGTANLYVDGVLVAPFSGDTHTDSATQLQAVEVACVSNNSCSWSELIVADEDTRSMNLWSFVPQAAGNTQSWTPNTLANINKLIIDDTSFISTTANNALSEWTGPTSPPAGTYDVRCVVQEARVRRSGTGPQHFDFLVRTASTDNLAGTSQAPSTSFGNFRYQWNTNPHTSGDWTVTEVTTAGFNLGIESLA